MKAIREVILCSTMVFLWLEYCYDSGARGNWSEAMNLVFDGGSNGWAAKPKFVNYEQI
jgi:hypothetical protein